MVSTTKISDELSKLDKQIEDAHGVFNSYTTPNMDDVLVSAKQRLDKLRKIRGKMGKGRKR